MKKALIIFIFLLGGIHASAQLIPNLGGQRAGISGLGFLKNDVNPRSVAMGGANIAVEGNGFSSNTNPAAMANVNYLTFASSNTFLPSGINQNYFNVFVPLKNGHNIGVNTNFLTTEAMEKRTEFQPDGTGEYFYATNMAIGTSYSKILSNLFSFGANIKYVREELAEYRAQTIVVDMGFLYNTDFKDLKFAVMLQSFGSNSTLKGNYRPLSFSNKPVGNESYPAPTIFKLGISMKPYKGENDYLLASVELHHPNDNAENIRIGVEYAIYDLVFFRGGYKINVRDQRYPTFGAGIRTRIGSNPLIFDYAANPTSTLGIFHTIGLTLKLSKISADDR